MPDIGDNSMTSEHRRALAYHWKGKYQDDLKSLSSAQSRVRNTVKKAKAEGVPLDTIKDLIRLATPEGEAELKSELQRKIEAAGWANSEIGTQFSFADIPDRSPLVERAYAEGRVAGYEAAARKSPYEGDAEQEWLRGYADGQKTLMESIDLTRKGMKQLEAEEAKKADEKAAQKDAREKAKVDREKAKQAKSAQPKKPRGRPKGSGKGKKANGSTRHLPGQTDVEDAARGQPEGGEEQSAA